MQLERSEDYSSEGEEQWPGPRPQEAVAYSRLKQPQPWMWYRERCSFCGVVIDFQDYYGSLELGERADGHDGRHTPSDDS